MILTASDMKMVMIALYEYIQPALYKGEESPRFLEKQLFDRLSRRGFSNENNKIGIICTVREKDLLER